MADQRQCGVEHDVLIDGCDVPKVLGMAGLRRIVFVGDHPDAEVTFATAPGCEPVDVEFVAREVARMGAQVLATRTRESERDAIHGWFELTYANYLVVPRSVLQSMPDEWQERFVACLREMQDVFGHLDWPSYEVKALARERELIQPKAPCDECDGRGRDADGECEFCDGLGEVDDGDMRYETGDEVGYREDPIPHYNRGRTRLEPSTAEATKVWRRALEGGAWLDARAEGMA